MLEQHIEEQGVLYIGHPLRQIIAQPADLAGFLLRVCFSVIVRSWHERHT